jgi:hypothetical protein
VLVVGICVINNVSLGGHFVFWGCDGIMREWSFRCVLLFEVFI